MKKENGKREKKTPPNLTKWFIFLVEWLICECSRFTRQFLGCSQHWCLIVKSLVFRLRDVAPIKHDFHTHQKTFSYFSRITNSIRYIHTNISISFWNIKEGRETWETQHAVEKPEWKILTFIRCCTVRCCAMQYKHTHVFGGDSRTHTYTHTFFLSLQRSPLSETHL